MLPVASVSALQVAVSSLSHNTVAPSLAIRHFLLQARQMLPDYLLNPSLSEGTFK